MGRGDIGVLSLHGGTISCLSRLTSELSVGRKNILWSREQQPDNTES